MTAETTDTPQQPAAVGAQVQRGVRPGFAEWHGGRYAGLQLAIAQAAWDVAIAAERERCAKQLDALGCDHCAAALRLRA
jgi:hypothetical protein